MDVVTHESTRISSSRIVGLDIARAVAVVGMVIVNFKVVMVSEPEDGWLSTITGLLEGRAAATFVVLAGIGLSVMTRRSRVSGDASLIRRDRSTIIKRAGFLFVLGLIYMPLWPADILHFYGAYLAIAAFLIVAPPRRLWILAAAFVVTSLLLLAVFDYETGWNWDTLDYADFWTPVGFIRNLVFNGFHPVVPWTAFVLVGMWLGRLDLRNPRIRRRLLAVSAALAVATEALSYVLVNLATSNVPSSASDDLALLLGTDVIPPVPLYMIAGGATAIAVILLCIELGERVRHDGWILPFVYTGQLALTLYVAHVVIGMGVLDATGNLYGTSLAFSVAAALIFSVLAIAFSWIWRLRFHRGPLEWSMRRITNT